ncbi:MAG TPA: hypothetical protein VFN11_14425, partial [Ktedonobacterales bacterium]|nr:hypothetical protein [Ktedonobacterales bacterium]
MKWFRLYSSVLNDPKVQQLPPTLFKHWINILCVASDYEPRGELPSIKELAFALRIKPAACERIVSSLRQVGVIDKSTAGQLCVHNWTQRQRESDNIAARVEKHRRRNNPDSDTVAIRNVTLHETLQKRSVDTDTERDTDTETFLVSEKDLLNVAVVEKASASAAVWNDRTLSQTAERIRATLRLPSAAVPNLKTTLAQYPCAPPYLEGEAASCAEYYANEAHKKVSLTGFNRWMKRSERERLQGLESSS